MRLFIAALALIAAPALAAPDPRDAQELAACLAKTEADAAGAYEDALRWSARGGAIPARHCAAVAMVAMGDVETGAERLAALADAPDAGDDEARALLLSKAANAWLILRNAERARAALDAAILKLPEDPDLRIDRARAAGLMGDWVGAEADLTAALAARPRDLEALVLRAEARIQRARVSEAELDVNAALQIDPRNVEVLVMRGRVREARRLGRAPD